MVGTPGTLRQRVRLRNLRSQKNCGKIWAAMGNGIELQNALYVCLYDNTSRGNVIASRGRGFLSKQTSDGLGLVSMRERLRLVGGTIKISSAIGLGTELEAVVLLISD